MTQTNKVRSNITALLLLAVTSSFLLHSCGNSKEEDHGHTAGYTIKGDTVVLTENSNIKSKLNFSTVAEQDFVMELTTAGIVRAIPTAYAEIAPPFAGRVLKSYVRLGQKVNAGSPVFEISSPDYFNSQKEYFDAKQEFRQAELNLKRQQDLLKNGVGVQRELEEAETEFTTKKSALSNASAALKIFNIDPENTVLGQALIVVSPIRGDILTNNIVIGQYLREDAEPLAIVAELSKVWIVGQVKEKDIRFIRGLDEVEVMVAAFPDRTIKGKIYHVNEIVNEETRSVEVLVECENPNHDLKPGMYVTVLFKDTPEIAILVPSKSVFQKEDKQFVFVKMDDTRFEKRQIETAGTSNGSVIVTSGLRTGEVIVSEGGSLMIRNY
ncbi:efflux RND transporter periplasmic adaptor subunit [Pedobacter chinensis]|uniref:Efflux RND transporter periplasmic adaptor subunit n=3 Tax=Sphingobacteriales TaxID=200666 RepID=A0A369PVP7_9SPHI|nr:MAG: efflux RND transporter periplasmic adaptor subunit [Pseudopedobacter saltans]RDC55315.1 efflux RND transporter periplasmic adaptor subunit [Pedobacter chinensis]